MDPSPRCFPPLTAPELAKAEAAVTRTLAHAREGVAIMLPP